MRRRVGGWNIALERLLRGDRPLPPLLSQALHIVLKHLEEIAPSKSNDDYLPHWLIAIDDDTYVNPITLLFLLSGVDASSSVMYGDK